MSRESSTGAAIFCALLLAASTLNAADCVPRFAEDFGCLRASYAVTLPNPGPAPNVKGRPGIATNGSEYLVAWSDERSGIDYIHTATFPAAGPLTQPTTRRLPEFAVDSRPVPVIWNGSSFVVNRSAASNGRDVLLVHENGEVTLATPDLNPQRGFPHQVLPRSAKAASDGERFLVVGLGDWPATHELQLNIIEADGSTKWPKPRLLHAPVAYDHLAVAWDGNMYAVVVTHQHEIRVLRVDREGALRESIVLRQGTGVRETQPVVIPGRGVLATWHEGTTTVGRYVSCGASGGRVTLGPADSVVASDGRTVMRARRHFVPEADRDGHAIVVATTPLSAFPGDCGDATITWGSEALVSISTPAQEEPALAVTRNGAGILWRERVGLRPSRVRGLRVDGGARPIAELALPRSSAMQWAPSVASDGFDFLALWHEGKEPNVVVRAMRLGRSFDEPVTLGKTYAPYSDASYPWYYPEEQEKSSPPAAIFNGRIYLAAWADDAYRMRVARFDRDGRLLDPGGVVVAGGEKRYGYPMRPLRPRMATNGEQTLLTWHERIHITCATPCIVGRLRTTVRAIRLDRDGRPMDAVPFELSASDDYDVWPTVVWNGEAFVVIWLDQTDVITKRLHAARITTDGRLLERRAIAELRDEVPPMAFVLGPFLYLSEASWRRSFLFDLSLRPRGQLATYDDTIVHLERLYDQRVMALALRATDRDFAPREEQRLFVRVYDMPRRSE